MLDVPTIEKVVSSEPSSSGAARDVWFFGDIVIKKDHYTGMRTTGCLNEFNNYQKFSESTFELNGEVWTVKFPETAMLGEYLIMQRITLPIPARQEECDHCTPHDNEHLEWREHGSHCPISGLAWKVRNHCETTYRLRDVHEQNFAYDWDNRVVWLLDFAG